MKRVIKERAFPGPDGGSDGMELRDWFAGQIIGVVMTYVLNNDDLSFGPSHADNNIALARCVYSVSDAMMKVREE